MSVPNGISRSAWIINLSTVGVALKTDIPLDIGQKIMIGRRPAKVTRRIDGGVSASFLIPLNEATFGENTVL